jgi:hypothetical protein
MEARKAMGFKVVIFLILVTIMFIALKREVWAHLHRAPRAEGEGVSSNSVPVSPSRAP